MTAAAKRKTPEAKTPPDRRADGLEVVRGAAAPAFEVVWVTPESVTPNELNWRVHPEFQSEVTAELLGKYGWLRPLLFNRRSGRLVDGHDRLKIARERGFPAVPLWVVDLDEAGEAEVLATLDEVTRLAVGDPKLLAAVTGRLGESSGALAEFAVQVRQENGVESWLASQSQRPAPATPLPFVAGTGGPGGEEEGTAEGESEGEGEGGPGSPADGPEPWRPEPSHVRMAQLFLDTTTFPRFERMVRTLQPHYGTGNATETVLRALAEAVERVAPGPEEPGV